MVWTTTDSAASLLRSNIQPQDKTTPIPSGTKPHSIPHASFPPNHTWFHTGSFASRGLRRLTFILHQIRVWHGGWYRTHMRRIFACFPVHNAQEKSRTRLSLQFSSFTEKLSISLGLSATPLALQNSHCHADDIHPLP
jgi:hypothetical protein